MTTLLEELSKKVAERWAALVVGPGLLFVLCFAVAWHLGFAHALDISGLRRYVSAFTADDTNRQTAGLIFLAAGATLGATVAGLAVGAAAQVTAELWMPTGPQWYVAALTEARARRWDRVDKQLTEARAEAARTISTHRTLGTRPPASFPRVHRLRARRDRLSNTRPGKPTWSAERMNEVASRVRIRYGLDLDRIWPHIWAVADLGAREDIQSAMTGYSFATRTTAWAAAYFAVACVTGWWPALLIGAALALLARRRGRESVEVLAVLTSSAVDLNIRTVAEKLGVHCPGALSDAAAEQIGALLSEDHGLAGLINGT